MNGRSDPKVVPIAFLTQHKDLLAHMQSIVGNANLAMRENRKRT